MGYLTYLKQDGWDTLGRHLGKVRMAALRDVVLCTMSNTMTYLNFFFFGAANLHTKALLKRDVCIICY